MRLWEKINRCITAGLLFLAAAALCADAAKHSGGLQGFFLLVFGGLDTRMPERFLFSFLLVGVPLVFFLFRFGAVFRKDFLISYVYVFTRLDSRGQWLREKTVSLAAQFFAAWAVCFAAVAVYGAVAGLENNLSFHFLALLFLTNFLPGLVLAFLQNSLSVWCGETSAFFTTLLFYVLSLLTGVLTAKIPVFNQFIFYLLPPVNGMYLWHEELFPLPANFHLMENLPIPGFVFWKSFLACLLWLALIYIVSLYRLKRSDLLEFGKEG